MSYCEANSTCKKSLKTVNLFPPRGFPGPGPVPLVPVCSAPCRRAFDSACRIWAAAEYDAERVSIFALRTAFYERARCVESDPASEGSQAPKTEKRTGEPLAAVVGLTA